MKFSSFLWFIIFQSAMTGILKSWYSVMTGIKIKNRGLRLLKYCKHVQGVLNDFDHQKIFFEFICLPTPIQNFPRNPKIILRTHENEFKHTETARLWICWIFYKDVFFYPLSGSEIGERTLK